MLIAIDGIYGKEQKQTHPPPLSLKKERGVNFQS